MIPSHTDLEELQSKFAEWRHTRKARNQPVPIKLRKMTADALQKFDLKSVLSITRLSKLRVSSIREEFYPEQTVGACKLGETGVSTIPPVVHMSEVFVTKTPPVAESPSRSDSTILVAAIDDGYGRSLKIFGGAGDPASLIKSFLEPQQGA